MGENLFSVLFSTIKSRFAPIVSKLRLWTSWNYVRTRVIGGIRDFFFRLLDVKPKNKNDYFTIFGWMVSKRLAYAVIIIVGVLSIWYIGATSKIYSKLTFRLVRQADTEVRFYISINEGEWELVAEYTDASTGGDYIPIVPRRCDRYSVKVEGTGACAIKTLTRRYRRGTGGRL